MRTARARREPRLKSYEGTIDGTILVEAESQREAVKMVREFAHRNKIKLNDPHVQVFLLRQPRPTFTGDGGEGDWDKEPL